MIVKEIKNYDLKVYSEKLSNGLSVYVLPMEHVNNIYATLSTKFGSIDDTFIPIGESKMITVPLGIAHFLEHKLFEQKDGIDPFTFFSERGADANANTSNFKTTYLFKGPDFFEENLNYLLDYVFDPYFTDENVEKEKGIIEEENEMYLDYPDYRLYEGLLNNLYKESRIKYPIVGTKESICKITKEDLYRCYNTFYHPSNMFLVITGNVDPEKVLSLVKENQAKKTFEKNFKVTKKQIKEPLGVHKKKETIEMDVNIPKLGLGYKINLKDIKMDLFDLRMYLSIYFSLKFSSTSLFTEKIINDGLVTDGVGYEFINLDDTSSIIIYADSEKYKELSKALRTEISTFNIEKEDFERAKKVIISSEMFESDSIERMNSKIMSDLITYNEVIYDIVDKVKNLKLDKLKELISKISFDDVSEYIILPKK